MSAREDIDEEHASTDTTLIRFECGHDRSHDGGTVLFQA